MQKRNDGLLIKATPWLLSLALMVGVISLGFFQWELLNRNSLLSAAFALNLFLIATIVALIRAAQIKHYVGAAISLASMLLAGYTLMRFGSIFPGMDGLVYNALVMAIGGIGLLMATILSGKGAIVNDGLFDERRQLNNRRTESRPPDRNMRSTESSPEEMVKKWASGWNKR